MLGGMIEMTEIKREKLDLTHQRVRELMDDYINHAKARGFEIKNFEGLNGYCNLMEKVLQIEWAINIGEKND